MAPKPQKRVAQDAKKVATAKKARTNALEVDTAEEVPLKPIEEAIEQAEGLSQQCRNMLVTGIRASFGIPSEERTDVHTLMVTMVDEVITGGAARLQQTLEAAKATEISVAADKAALASKLSDAEVLLADKSQRVEEAISACSVAKEKVVAATGLLAEKKEIQRAGDDAVSKQQADKACVERVIENDMKAISEGVGDCTDVLLLLQNLNCDESLVKALPATCARAPSERGAFDGMVLSQLETSLKEKLTEISNLIEGSIPDVEQRAGAVDAAQQQVTEAEALLVAADEAQVSAEACQCDASTAVNVAKEALVANVPEETTAAQNREHAETALRDFQMNTRGLFDQMRDKTSTQSVEVLDVALEPKLASPEPKVANAFLVGGA